MNIPHLNATQLECPELMDSIRSFCIRQLKQSVDVVFITTVESSTVGKMEHFCSSMGYFLKTHDTGKDFHFLVSASEIPSGEL